MEFERDQLLEVTSVYPKNFQGAQQLTGSVSTKCQVLYQLQTVLHLFIICIKQIAWNWILRIQYFHYSWNSFLSIHKFNYCSTQCLHFLFLTSFFLVCAGWKFQGFTSNGQRFPWRPWLRCRGGSVKWRSFSKNHDFWCLQISVLSKSW